MKLFATFHSDLVTKYHGGNLWELRVPLIVEYGRVDKAVPAARIEIPVEFLTDMASVPRIFWNIISPWGKYGKTAVFHDFLYYGGYMIRKLCDRFMLAGMKAQGVGWFKRHVMYQGVRIGGRKAWKEHRVKCHSFILKPGELIDDGRIQVFEIVDPHRNAENHKAQIQGMVENDRLSL